MQPGPSKGQGDHRKKALKPCIKRTIANEWSKMHDMDFKYIHPGKPTQNAFVERFNESYTRGVLNKYIFENIYLVRQQT